MSKNPLLGWPAADARQRIHIDPNGPRVAWSFGPRTALSFTETVGQAVEAALERIGHEPVVVIIEGRTG